MTNVQLDLQKLLDDGVALKVMARAVAWGGSIDNATSEIGEYQITLYWKGFKVYIRYDGDVEVVNVISHLCLRTYNQFSINELLAPYNILDRIEEGKFGEWLESEYGVKWIDARDYKNEKYQYCIVKSKIYKELAIELGNQYWYIQKYPNNFPMPYPTSKRKATDLLESLGIRKGEGK